MFSYISAERRVPEDHPLRAIRAMADRALTDLDKRFAGMYAALGRPSIALERLLRALLLQVLYTVRSERLLMEQLDYNFLFRWFVGLSIDEPVWDVTVFTKNRDRLLQGEVAKTFFAAVLAQARQRDLLSDEHFMVDGTLIEAWAGHKSFKRKDGQAAETSPQDDDPGNPSVDFHGERRSNETHQSTTDPEARLARKGAGKEAKLSFGGDEPRHPGATLGERSAMLALGPFVSAQAARHIQIDRSGRQIHPGVFELLGYDPNLSPSIVTVVDDALPQDRVRVVRPLFEEGSPTTLDNSDKFSDNALVRCCPKLKHCLIILVELTRIERATS